MFVLSPWLGEFSWCVFVEVISGKSPGRHIGILASEGRMRSRRALAVFVTESAWNYIV